MNKVFLDFGANRLQGLTNVFRNRLNIDESWIIHSYEPNKKVFERALVEMNYSRYPSHSLLKYKNFKLHNVAVSDVSSLEEIKNIIEYNHRTLGLTKGDAGGSTLVKDVCWWDEKDVKFEVDTVQTVDVNEILTSLFSLYGENMEIYIKCDIEGYEYKVIRRLTQSQHINLIKAIYIEWHPHFFKDTINKKAEAFDLIRHINYKHPQILVSMHY